MKVVILDENIAVLHYFNDLLKNFKVEVEIFLDANICLEYINKNKDIDIFFIDEKFVHLFEDISLYFLVILSYEIKENINLNNKIFYRMKKDILPLEFDLRFKIILEARKIFLKEKEDKKELTNILSYKENQEEMAIKKQLKLFYNQLYLFYENDYLIETYFNSKDILSGDGIITKRIDENRYFIAVIDAMGKGVSASLTSTNSVGFFKYELLKYSNKEFNFENIIYDFIDYAKSILIENETLCFVAGYLEENRFKFVNFGMPPIYVDKEKIKANNMPLSEWSKEIKFDEVEFKNDVLIYSDGLIEAPTKDDSLYFFRFKNLLNNFTFLKDIYYDFKKNAIQSDDTTIIYIRKDTFSFKKIFSKQLNISLESINQFLLNFHLDIPKEEKIIFILQELLINSYEHNVNKKDKAHLLRDKKIDKNKNLDIISLIDIYENEEFIKIEYSDNGKGFDIEILKDLTKNKFHGRGIKMMKLTSEALFFNKDGNKAKIFLRK